MNDIANELASEGHDVDFLLINGPSDSFPNLLADKADFPVFQDTGDVNAWTQHGGGKDDMIIYGPDNTLHTFLEFGGDISINLSSDAGKTNVKNAILEALGALP